MILWSSLVMLLRLFLLFYVCCDAHDEVDDKNEHHCQSHYDNHCEREMKKKMAQLKRWK